jgi:hypothetical protein
LKVSAALNTILFPAKPKNGHKCRGRGGGADKIIRFLGKIQIFSKYAVKINCTFSYIHPLHPSGNLIFGKYLNFPQKSNYFIPKVFKIVDQDNFF